MKRDAMIKAGWLCLLILFCSKGFSDTALNYAVSTREIPVLLFHEVGAGEEGRYLPVKRFQWMMDYLKRNQITTLSVSQYIDHLKQVNPVKGKSVVITFDDGERSVYENAFPILKERGLQASVFIVSDFIGKKWYHTVEDRSYSLVLPEPIAGKRVWKFDMMDWDEIREMQKYGFEIESHSKAHAELVTADATNLQDQILGSKIKIENQIKAPVNYFSYPWGEFNSRVQAAVEKANYHAAFTTDIPNPAYFSKNIFAIERYEISPYTSLRDFKIMVWGFMPWKIRLKSFLTSIPFYESTKTLLRKSKTHGSF